MRFKERLCKLSGDDYTIIRTCDARVQNRFAAIGAFVFLIFVLCFVSSYLTFTQLFQSYLLGIPAGFFFASMITNIYLLLLYTLSKHMLPHNERYVGRLVSLAIRFTFICFIAIVISKPIEALIFFVPLNSEVSKYKEEELRQFELMTNEFFDDEIAKLKRVINVEILTESPVNNDRLGRYKALISEKEKKREELLSRMRFIVGHSNYYVRSIVLLNTRYKACWLITIIVVSVFFLPAYLKKVISATGLFYARKGDIERGIIKREYTTFRENYARIFKSSHNAEIQFVELFEDPPYNTTPKSDNRKFLKDEDLIADLYNA
jgi:hypothetical protein